ncbi:hypothetical protein Scep_001475 [Stephania cephalantha]|uniref:Uncharacterized protein n=1 Tax=Stephania cephalantha TaxID=152367 RepID=A0AAP0Q532_9MAGN
MRDSLGHGSIGVPALTTTLTRHTRFIYLKSMTPRSPLLYWYFTRKTTQYLSYRNLVDYKCGLKYTYNREVRKRRERERKLEREIEPGKKKKGWRDGRIRRRTSGSGVEPAVTGGGSQLRGAADGGSSEAGVQPGERRCSIGLSVASAHSSSGRRLVWTERRDGEPARSSDMAAAPARTSCGAAEHRFSWRDAATPAVTPAARHRRGGSDACAAPASGGAGDRRAAAAATAARQRQRRL